MPSEQMTCPLACEPSELAGSADIEYAAVSQNCDTRDDQHRDVRPRRHTRQIEALKPKAATKCDGTCTPG
jgi:hypothetical protein